MPLECNEEAYICMKMWFNNNIIIFNNIVIIGYGIRYSIEVLSI